MPCVMVQKMSDKGDRDKFRFIFFPDKRDRVKLSNFVEPEFTCNAPKLPGELSSAFGGHWTDRREGSG